MPEPLSVDGLLPPQMAAKAEDIGVAKGNMPALRMLLLGVMAGAFIGLAAAFATTVTTGNGLDGAVALPYGVMKLLAGLAFCLGLVLVVVAGAELFTGNTLLIMAVVSRKLPVSKLLWNWLVVYVGNFVGSVATAYLVLLTAQHYGANGHLGTNALGIAAGKCELSFTAAFTRGIYCNALVCLAVWLCYSCRTTTDRILAILFPITAFVAMGFEHSVANM